jgi:hypothetical protein
METIEKVEKLQFRGISQESSDSKESIRLEPEVVGREIIDRRVYEENFFAHGTKSKK